MTVAAVASRFIRFQGSSLQVSDTMRSHGSLRLLTQPHCSIGSSSQTCALGMDSERAVTYVVATTSTAAKCSGTPESEALLLALPSVAASVQQRKVNHCLL